MWRRNALVVALVLVQELTSHGVEEEVQPTNLLARQRWVRFDLVLGRVTATHLRGGHGQRTREAGNDVCHQRLIVNGDLDEPSVQYERSEGSRSISVTMVDRTELTIVVRNAGPGDSEILRFTQPRSRPLELYLADGSESRSYRANSLWHLLLAEPELCQEHLLPLLALIRPDWQLARAAERVETELFRSARHEPQITVSEVRRLVHQLNAASFARRRAADLALRDLGVSLLPFLDQIDAGLLSEEQRMRIHRVRLHLSAAPADSTARVTAWLMNDKAIWLDLLAHREADKREAAATHLTGIHAGQILFDPFAEETRRNEQIARLRLRLAGN